MNILITGGTGFIGQNIAKAYLTQGHRVFITGREAPVPGCVYLGPDFQAIDFDKLPDIDVVNHQAAITDPQHPDEAEVWRVNYRDAVVLFRKAARRGVKKIVYASSAAVYGLTAPPFREDGPFDPLTAYGKSKLALDRLPINAIGLRYSNVWGPGEGHKGKLSSQVRQIGQAMLKGERPRLFKHGEQRRDFVHVDDVVRANVLAGGIEGRAVFNVGAGCNVSFNDIVAFWNQELGTDLQPEWIDNPYQATYQAETLLDISKASGIGWKPQVELAGNSISKAYGRD